MLCSGAIAEFTLRTDFNAQETLLKGLPAIVASLPQSRASAMLQNLGHLCSSVSTSSMQGAQANAHGNMSSTTPSLSPVAGRIQEAAAWYGLAGIFRRAHAEADEGGSAIDAAWAAPLMPMATWAAEHLLTNLPLPPDLCPGQEAALEALMLSLEDGERSRLAHLVRSPAAGGDGENMIIMDVWAAALNCFAAMSLGQVCFSYVNSLNGTLK